MRRTRHTIARPGRLLQAVFRQSKHILLHKYLYFQNAQMAPIKDVGFWPGRPHPYSVIYKVFHRLGIKIKCGLPDPQRGCRGFLWLDDTFAPCPPVAGLVNGRCLDISKAKLDLIHADVFGYSLAVDPIKFQDRMVVKSNQNGTHDGQELKGPLTQLQPDCVYQRVVDNRPSDGNPDLVSDYRVTVFGGRLGFGYNKVRSKLTRFSNTNLRVTIVPKLEAVFSADELALIERFARVFGLDYGEMDVVRDYVSKSVFVLDVNKTPLGPPNGLSLGDQKRAMDMLIDYFVAWINRDWKK